MKKTFYLFLASLLGIHLFLLMNLRFTAWPEMLSYPYLLNNGFKLYTDFVHPYPPLLTIILAWLYKLFGYNQLVLKGFAWVLILASDLLIFKIVRRLTKKESFGLFALTLYIFTQPFLEGNQLWFDLAIVAPLLLGISFFLKEKNVRNLILAGTFLGIASLIKQTSGLFLVAAFSYLIVSTKDIKKTLPFMVGPLVLGSVLGAYLLLTNSLADFVNWNFVYPFAFWGKFPGYVQMNLTNRQLLVLGILLFPLSILPAQNYKTVFKDKILGALGIFLILSFVMVYPRFSFFHFQLALALIVVVFGYLSSQFKFPLVFLAAFGMLILFVITLPGIKRDWGAETRFWNKEDLAIAEKIRDQVKNNGVYLLGQPSSLYVFSGTLPPKPWLDNYGWYFEIPGIKADTISRWENNPPMYVVWQGPEAGNWYDLGVYQPKELSAWIKANYTEKELIGRGTKLWRRRD